MKHVDTVIIGGGIAGTVLALRLLNAGHDFIMLNSPRKSSASVVAAGLINPIAGKRFETTWNYEAFYHSAKQYYSSLQCLEQSKEYFSPIDLIRVFGDKTEKNIFEKKYIPETPSPYVGKRFTKYDSSIHASINNDYGGFYTEQAALFEYVSLLQDAHRKLLPQLVQEDVDIHAIRYQKGVWKIPLKDLTVSSNSIVFCDGWHGMNNNYLPSHKVRYDVTKGEMCIIEAHDLPETQAISKGFAIIPIGNHKFRCAATFQWNEYHTCPTEFGYNRLFQRINSLLQCSWTMLEHSAGIRPTVFDHKPIVGKHPEHDSLFILGGLGTKGALYAPYFSQKIQLLLEGQETIIDNDVSIDRWWNL